VAWLRGVASDRAGSDVSGQYTDQPGPIPTSSGTPTPAFAERLDHPCVRIDHTAQRKDNPREALVIVASLPDSRGATPSDGRIHRLHVFLVGLAPTLFDRAGPDITVVPT